MKYRIYALLSILVVCFFLLGSMHKLRASDRGEKQLSFTTSDHSTFGGLPSDSNAAKVKEEAREKDETGKDRETDVSRSAALTPPGQQAGEAANAIGRENRSRMGDGDEAIRKQDGMNDLRQGHTSGQTSNVPGTTSTSPNATSNLFGTGGIPIFPEDRAHR